jgi:phosphonate transport system substrate-binding protein
MYSIIKKTTLLSLLLLVVSLPLQAQVKIGILPRLAATELTKMFTPLADYIGKQIDQKVELVIPKDFDTFNQMMKSGKFDYAYANPNIYTDARSSLGKSVEPLVIAVETGSGKTFTGCFLVKKGSSIKSVSDFKGKKLIFVDENSAGGYLSQVYTIKQSGLSRKDITILPFAKKHTNVALAVQNGSADIGGIRTADFEKIKSQVSIPDVVLLSESASIPNWPLFSLPNSNKELTEKIKKALLTLKPNTSESKSLLKEAKLDGFVPASDADFDSMRKVSQTANSF